VTGLLWYNGPMQVILGAIAVAAGIFVVIKTDSLMRTFGRMGWAEKYLATSGGSRTGYKLLGIAAIFFGLMAMVGLFSGFAGGFLTKLFVR
jgi:hypothetical protein